LQNSPRSLMAGSDRLTRPQSFHHPLERFEETFNSLNDQIDELKKDIRSPLESCHKFSDILEHSSLQADYDHEGHIAFSSDSRPIQENELSYFDHPFASKDEKLEINGHQEEAINLNLEFAYPSAVELSKVNSLIAVQEVPRSFHQSPEASLPWSSPNGLSSDFSSIFFD